LTHETLSFTSLLHMKTFIPAKSIAAAAAAVALFVAMTLHTPEVAAARQVEPAGGLDESPAAPIPRRSRTAATRPVEAIRSLLTSLADPSPDVRDRARTELLQLDPADLPTLKALVAAGEANHPSQRDALYDIVRHVYLVGERPPRGEDPKSFIGVSNPTVRVSASDSVVGMTFGQRLMGFPAFGALQEGDLIIGVREFPSVQFTATEVVTALRATVPPNKLIHFRVIRETNIVEVPIKLTHTPGWELQRGDIPRMLRLERADEYWETNFAPAFAAATASAARAS
jgi:hypothetical protein